jgi:hypothetical protein
MRSYDQFARKVIQVGTGYEKLDYRSPEVGRDQLKLLQVHRENGLQAYYDDALLDDATLRQGLSSGRIVLDGRLRMFMEGVVGAARQADRPDGPATRAFVADGLRAMLCADTTRGALEQAQAELTATGAALTQARAEAASLARNLALTRTATGSLVNLGRAMGGGHLLRRSPRLRRLWHQATGRSPRASRP